MARVMAPERHRMERGVATASEAGATPLSLWRPLAFCARTAQTSAGGSEIVRSGAIKFEGKSDTSVQAVTFLEGVEPHVEVDDAKVAVVEALRAGVAPPLFAPSLGVVGTENARGMQVEELTDRSPHARTAFPPAVERRGGLLCRC